MNSERLLLVVIAMEYEEVLVDSRLRWVYSLARRKPKLGRVSGKRLSKVE